MMVWYGTVCYAFPNALRMHLISYFADFSLAIVHALKAFERISNERQRHISRVLLAQSFGLSTVSGCRVFLRDFINREIRNVDVGFQIRLERRTDGAELVPFDTIKEGVSFDLLAAIGAGLAADAVGDVAE